MPENSNGDPPPPAEELIYIADTRPQAPRRRRRWRSGMLFEPIPWPTKPLYGFHALTQMLMGLVGYGLTIATVGVLRGLDGLFDGGIGNFPWREFVSYAVIGQILFTFFVVIRWRWPWYAVGLGCGFGLTCLTTSYY